MVNHAGAKLVKRGWPLKQRRLPLKFWRNTDNTVRLSQSSSAIRGFTALACCGVAGDAVAAQRYWLLQSAEDHPAFMLGVLAVFLVATFLAWRLLRLWRSNRHLSALAEERVGVIDSLVESESQLQNLTDISPVGILFIDVNGKFLYANRRFELICGRSAASFSEGGWQLALHPGDRSRVMSQWNSTSSVVAPILFEARIVTPADETIWVLGQSVAQRDENGGIVGNVLTITDITQRKQMEQALAERDARFRASERIARIGHWERNYHTDEIYWSEQVYRIYGLDQHSYTPEFEDVYSRMHPEDRETVIAAAKDVWEKGGHYEVEHRIVLPDGEIRWVHVQTEMILDDVGAPLLFRGTIQDIHEIRATRNALRQSEERFGLAFDASGSGLAISDIEGRFVRANPAFCSFLGYRMEELLQMHRDDVAHPEELDSARDVPLDLIAGRENLVSREKRYVRKDGRVVWAITTTVTAIDPFDGKNYFIASVQDITEIRRTREALKQSEERFRSAFEASGTSMMITDRDGFYKRVNPAFCKLMGYEREELLRLRRSDLGHPDDIANIHDAYRRLFMGEIDVHSRESQYVRKDGEIVWGIITSVLVEGTDGEEPHVINNLQDITERKAAEQALAENEARLVRAQRIADIGDWERDTKTGEITWSAQTPLILGVDNSAPGMAFEQFLEIVHPDDLLIVIEGNRRAIDEGAELGQDFRIIRPDTCEIRYVRSEAEVVHDANGRPTHIAGTLQDITLLKMTETALLKSEARFRGMFDAGATGVILTSMKNYAVQVNKAFEDFVGYSEEEILIMEPLGLVHPADRPEALAGRVELLEKRAERIYSERRFIHRDGSVRWANVAIALLDTDDDEEQFSIVAVQDITDRKLADEELARKTKLLDLVREIALAANQATEYEDVVQFCLERVCAFTGWPVGHGYLIKDVKNSVIEYLPIWHLSDAEKYAPFVEASEQVHVRRGVHLPGEVLEKRNVVWREKIPRRDAGNESRGAAVRRAGLKSGFGAPVMVGNEVVAVIEFFSDEPTPRDEEIVDAMRQVGTEIGRVFERKRAEEQLRHSEQQLRQIIDNAPLWIFVKNVEGRYLLANEAMGSVYNLTGEELIGKRQEDIYPYREMTARIKETDRDVIESGQTKVFPEWRLFMPNGEERCMRLVKMPYKMQDGEVCVLGIGLDITDEKRVEEERWRAQRLDALGQMTGGVAHDFNNLLTIILGNLQLLGRRLDDPALLKLTGAAERAARRGGDVTGRLLAFARSQPLEALSVDLNALVKDALPLIERTAGQGLEIECALDEGLKSVLADPAQIESALINLTANARDAMPDGGKITITTENVEVIDRPSDWGRLLAPGNYVMVSVRDNGTGMDSDIAARALEPFFTTKAVGKGSGLGLPSVYGFAEQSGGGVTIDSEPGEGTCVSIYLPQSSEKASVAAPMVAVESTGRQEMVLLVEDDPDVRDYARAVLKSLNYRVLEAADGDEALAILHGQQHLDLLFSDVILPGELDGRAIAREALKIRPDLRVILTSGNWDLTSPNIMPMLEGAAILPKPYTQESLADIIQKVLATSKSALAGG
jgi:PAS domain S-box-containing protein